MTPATASPSGLPHGTVPVRAAGHRFVAVIALAVALHAALFMSLRRAPFDDARTPSAAVRAVSVRTIWAPAEPKVRTDAVTASQPKDAALPAATAQPLPAMRAESAVPVGTLQKTASTALSRPAPVEPHLASEAPPDASRPALVPPSSVLPPAPDYFQRSSLDTPPHPLHDIDPLYPDEAQLRSGSVVVRLLIGEAGDVDTAAVVRASPPGLFDASALAAFGSAKFAPGLRGGAPVKSQVTVEVEFTPMNRGAAVAGRSY